MLTQEQITLALWRQLHHLEAADQEIEPLLKVSTSRSTWLKHTRASLLFSTEVAAKRLGISRSAYCQLEEREANGQITILRLREIAETLNCELIYFIRPHDRKNFSAATWMRIANTVEEKAACASTLPHFRGRQKAALARGLLEKKEELAKAEISRQRR